MHLKILRFCRTKNMTKGAFIREIYNLIKNHEGKDFKDLDDLFTKLWPQKVVERVAGGVNIHYKGRRRREPPYYDTPIQDLEEEAEHP